MPEIGALPAVCIVGCASWDTLMPVDHYPIEGEYCVASAEIEQPGGTSTNFAVALARLGAPPRFVGMVGDDWRGERLRAGLTAAGVLTDTVHVRTGQDSDRSIIPISPAGSRTIFWIKGAMLQRGDMLDTGLIYGHRLVYLDLVDLDLWSDLLDLHTRQHAMRPDAPRLVGQAVYVAGILAPAVAGAFISRHHVFIGGGWEWRLLMGETDDTRVVAAIGALIRAGGLLDTAIVTRGAAGCTLITRDGVADVPAFTVDVQDTTGAGDAFAAGFAYGLVQRWEPMKCARFANAVGGLATRGFGAQTSLPTLDEATLLAFGEQK